MTTTVTPSVLCPETEITNTAAIYITGPANAQVIIKRGVFTNVTGGAVTITVHRVVSAGSVAAANMLISARSVAAGETDLAPELANMVLDAGDTIRAFASANTSINFTASGFVAT